MRMTAVLLLAAACFAGCSDDEHPEPAVPEVTVTGDYTLQTGDKLETLTLIGSAVADGQSVEGAFTWKDGRTVYNQIGEYDAGWIFTPADAARYTSKEGVVKITVLLSAEEVIARFKDYFYEDGKVYANRLNSYQPAEWVLAARDARKLLDIFTQITDKPAPMKDNYEYDYSSRDGNCTISIKGSSQADTDHMFGTLQAKVPGCEDLQTVHLLPIDYFTGDNSAEMVTGVPVIYAI